MKKPVNYRLQSYLSLIPYLGFIIVMFTSFYNVYRINKRRLDVLLYFLQILIPLIVFGGAFFVAMMFIKDFENITLQIVMMLITSYVAGVCMAISCIGIAKGMINRLKKNSQGE